MLDFGREEIRREEAQLKDQLETWLEDNAYALGAAENADIDWHKHPIFYYREHDFNQHGYQPAGAFLKENAASFFIELVQEHGFDKLIAYMSQSVDEAAKTEVEFATAILTTEYIIDPFTLLGDLGYTKFDATEGIELEDEIHG